jgi:PadR family transcriptional regulator PadR
MTVSSGPRMTISTQLVLELLLADPGRELYGLEIGQDAGLPSGTVHPILARLEALGWVSSRWETVDPAEAGRPARRYYRMTAEGAPAARAALARAHRPALLHRASPLGGLA